MNAAERAHSPKRLRKRLGIVKATAKALARTPAPKNLAAKLSRKTPRMRLMRVRPEMRRACLTKPAGLAGGASGKAVDVTPIVFAKFWDIRFPVLLFQFCLQSFGRACDIVTSNDSGGYCHCLYTSCQDFIDIPLGNSRNGDGGN